MTDTIADMLTRIRNALIAKHDSVDIPASTMKKAIAQILVEEGYVKSYEVLADGEKKTIRIQLKYGPNKQRVIVGIKRISRPGLRFYARKDEMPKVLGGLGIAIVSTSRGVMTDREARKQGVGGEVLAYVW
ncbi:MAG: 30S ribosomal protein S8 [Eubacteriales bacterium]|nr:30S ribosomal protein S8 [Eubacteriales bacterium]